jgi:choice-of-anchor B domain-containing protein
VRSGVPAPGAAADQAVQPIVARQFASVSDADWTPDKPLVGREIDCENGKAKIFDCKDVSLLAFLPESLIGGPQFTALKGWTDPASGREFVVAGRAGGTSFVEISDPLNPRYLGELPFHAEGEPSRWRDIKVYKNHAFIVSEGGNHGMQVFDLTQLLGVTAAPAVFRETAHYGRISSAHTLAVDTAAGFAYPVGVGGGDGSETCGGGLHMIDIRNPAAPTFAGCYPETLGGSREGGYIHEAECVVYYGPDARYRDRQICLNAAGAALGIVDVTDKKQPKVIGVGRYPNIAYAHQGWLMDDQRYFFMGDEGDEDGTHMTRTIVFDMKNLDDPVVAKEFFGTTVATDHNLYIRGRYVYQANYRAGLRILDIADPANPKEVAYFDTTPGEAITAEMGGGSWDNYPYFKNGVIAVSTYRVHDVSVGPGLFILRYRPGAAR